MDLSSAVRKRAQSLSIPLDKGRRSRAPSFSNYDSDPPSLLTTRPRIRRVSGVDRRGPPPQFIASPTGSSPFPDSTGHGGVGVSEPRKKHAEMRALSLLPPKYVFPRQPELIYFYHKHNPHYGFTNFSPHAVIYNGRRYPTSEHLFQSFKFQEHRPLLAEHIRMFSDRPSDALSEARRFQPEVRKDWLSVNLEKMDETLWHKFTQHADLKKELLATGDAILIEDSDKDSFWGVGFNRKGRNELGKALVRLRSRLRSESVGAKMSAL